MRIFYLISSLKIGGAEVALANLLPGIQAKGHTCTVAYFHDGPIRARIEALGITTIKISGPFHHYDPWAIIRLFRSIKQFNPDILHTSLWSANIIGRILGKLLKIPVASDLHGNCLFEGRIRNWGDRLTARWSTATIAVSDGVAAAYKTLCPATAPTLITIKNGIDASALQTRATATPLSRSELGIPETAFIVGSVGRLENIKGYELLVRACAAIPNNPTRPLWLCIVGDGSCKSDLVRLASELGIADRVLLTGFRNDAFRFYRIFDCFALSSFSPRVRR